ncbi:tyrosine--tRNA ligase, partial [Candidatus Curtissbacteria bacterium RBG_13_35_7]
EKILREGKKLRVYQGFDPSTPVLHIGHMVGLRKLKKWQDLGHEVIFLIGDFTGRIGDPTGREETRPLLSKKTVSENAKTYKVQVEKILDFSAKNPVKIKFNSQWLEKLSAPEILNLYSHVTYQQIIKRGMFKKRLEKDEDISFNEISYPIMQGYDSVAMGVDVEIGGRDQLFNMMIGRDLMHKIKHKNKFVMTTQLLVDNQGNKIGKTEGNAIELTLPAVKMFSAIMNFPDDVITKSLEYLTDTPM